MAQATGKRRIDRITSGGYLDGLQDRPIEDVRAMRDDCRAEENILSFERRLLQARADILRAELERRAGVGGSLIDRLPSILSDDGPPVSRGALPMIDPPMDLDRPKRRVEKLIADDTLVNLEKLSEADVTAIIATLDKAERQVSESRRSVQRVLDAVTADIARRYKSGDA